jgi:hypothetical protein
MGMVGKAAGSPRARDFMRKGHISQGSGRQNSVRAGARCSPVWAFRTTIRSFYKTAENSDFYQYKAGPETSLGRPA